MSVGAVDLRQSEPVARGFSTARPASHIWLGRCARLTSVATFFLIIAGSLVTTTDSGLAVPDWPLSFGQFFPPMEGGVLFEHGHRLVAGSVGVLMTALAIWVLVAERRRWVRMLAVAAWVAVVVQAILGGMTVLMKLPVAVSSAHAGLAMAFFCATAILASALSDKTQMPSVQKITIPRVVLGFGFAAVGITYIQIILGAVMRHMGAGLAIPDFPLAWGKLIPPLHATSIAVHFAHRVGAVTVGVVFALLLWSVYRHQLGDRVLRRRVNLLSVLYGLQFSLGAWTIWSMKSLHVTTTHVAVGALTLVTAVMVAMRMVQLKTAVRGHRQG
ncbi:MAG TPA: COX15/CtaA family protein [candidate division Zixibacteria bacterium]|nr:COX15/CtaA family protein [candidate division Zixibacteria bacterium]